MTEVTLKPCPLCKSDEVSHGYTYAGGLEMGNCECHSCGLVLWKETEAEAIATWNDRASSAVVDTLREALDKSNAFSAGHYFDSEGVLLKFRNAQDRDAFVDAYVAYTRAALANTRPASTEPADALADADKANWLRGDWYEKWQDATENADADLMATLEALRGRVENTILAAITRTDALAEARDAETHVEWRVHSGSGHNPPRVFTSESEAFEHARTEAVVPSYIREGAFRNAQVVKVTQTFEVTDLNGAALSRLNAQGEKK